MIGKGEIKNAARHPKTRLGADCLDSNHFGLANDRGGATLLGAVVRDRDVARDYIAGHEGRLEETVKATAAEVLGSGLHGPDHRAR